MVIAFELVSLMCWDPFDDINNELHSLNICVYIFLHVVVVIFFLVFGADFWLIIYSFILMDTIDAIEMVTVASNGTHT